MRKIDIFKKHLREKRAVKVIAGIDNFNIDKVKKVAMAAQSGFASAVDVACDEKVVKAALSCTKQSVFVSSIHPFELAKAVSWGADAVEIGNFDALYKQGVTLGAKDVYEIVLETMNLVQDTGIYICATIPGHIPMAEQIELAKRFELLGVDLIQTEGAKDDIAGAAGKTLFEKAQTTIANTLELSRQVGIPIMSASGITAQTAPLAFAAGASAVGIGSCVSRLDSQIEMVATVRNVVGAIAYRKPTIETAQELEEVYIY
ncbi:hypothetical protein tpqmel_0142 [Candidatus Gastranaerophilus sp. (ex Termes propinquus)]|nr:hypothetical protein tpqmel_0142 [Candidatus Gastranaerophilus sp. (ex Termes propinquus)]